MGPVSDSAGLALEIRRDDVLTGLSPDELKDRRFCIEKAEVHPYRVATETEGRHYELTVREIKA
jgi:hypothetical protein